MGKEAKTNAMRILERAKVPYTCLLYTSIQDDKNYFSETDIDDQPYYYQYESYKSQVSQKAFDASPIRPPVTPTSRSRP